jgi:Na+/H+ antiporter NhaD/arsenite permease-like protein
MSDLAILGTYAVFIASYIVFALGKFPGMKVDRPGAAIIGAVLMFMTGAVRVDNSLRLIHFGTIVLLFSMMLVVAYLHLAGFFDWVTELVVTRLNPHHLLPTVIFLSGLLSAFFVNDIICLVMVPFVLKVTGRMGIKPIPYLLAVATASNIGSTATITGNPQNILIGSFSRIGYRDFFWHLGPVALVGLFLDWFVLWFLYFRGQIHDVRTERAVNAVRIEHAALLKAGIVAALVLAGFLAGFSPAMIASVGAAILLITRTRDPHLVYEEVDWGLLVFLVGLFLVSNVPAVMLLKSLVSQFANTHSAWLTLAMASTLAGNLTITGSVANIIVVERAQKEARITFFDYFRIGLPVTLLTLLFGWLWLSWVR